MALSWPWQRRSVLSCRFMLCGQGESNGCNAARNLFTDYSSTMEMLSACVRAKYMEKRLEARQFFEEGSRERPSIHNRSTGLGHRWILFPGSMGQAKAYKEFWLASNLLKSEPMKLVDGGQSQRTFVYVKDAIDTVMRMVFPRLYLRTSYWCHTGVSGRPQLDEPTIDMSSKEFYGEGYDDSDKRIPDMTIIKKQLEWEPLFDLLESTLTYQHKTYARAMQKPAASGTSSRSTSAIGKGGSSGEVEDQSKDQSFQRMIKLPCQILGQAAVPCPTGDHSDEWEVMCCMEGFVITYCRKLGEAHLFNLSNGTSHPITWLTNFMNNLQMVYLRNNIYVAADFKLQKYNPRLDKWSLQQRLPLGCELERLFVLQDGIVGVFKRESFPCGIKTVKLEWRFLDLDYKGVNKKGWRPPFATDVIEDGVIPGITTLNNVVLVMVKWFRDTNTNWLFFWNDNESDWEFLDGKLEGNPVTKLVAVGENELYAYTSPGDLVSKIKIHWDKNGHVSSVDWES
ncbi:hypothetical protein SELMODRAFT_408703 [Selaginella moellendorffii]|uniref:NAD-dependent epimerase/dehydratase domain-containing protein n=1 Tax=Selaginella moellendorffii TaxID=88036 RepID=D8R9P3_SELML|nr:hypothetical protein SELMODRAFT_408703 [Selaginella moellendorffii]